MWNVYSALQIAFVFFSRELIKQKRKIWESKTGYSKNWRKLNSDKVAEYKKKAFEKLKSNPEKYEQRLKSESIKNKVKYANNPEIYKEKAKRYYLLNKEKAHKTSREWAKKHPEIVTIFLKENFCCIYEF